MTPYIIPLKAPGKEKGLVKKLQFWMNHLNVDTPEFKLVEQPSV